MLNSPARPRGPVIGLLTFLFAVTLQSQAPPLPLPSTPLIFAGSGPGGGLLTVLRADGTPLVTAAPFGGGFTGGVRVAAGDVNGDGITDVVVAMASGGGHVRMFSGADGSPLGDSARSARASPAESSSPPATSTPTATTTSCSAGAPAAAWRS